VSDFTTHRLTFPDDPLPAFVLVADDLPEGRMGAVASLGARLGIGVVSVGPQSRGISQVHLTVEADDDALRELVERLPASASSDYGEPFGKVLKDANFDFYAIDPLLFSPAQVRLTSVGGGRSVEAGRVNLEVLERSFWG